jgi:hypothetical protein
MYGCWYAVKLRVRASIKSGQASQSVRSRKSMEANQARPEQTKGAKLSTSICTSERPMIERREETAGKQAGRKSHKQVAEKPRIKAAEGENTPEMKTIGCLVG